MHPRRQPRGVLRLLLVAVLVTGVVACQVPAGSFQASPAAASATPGSSAGATAAAVTTAPTPDRLAGWRSDLELIVPGMDRIHPNLSHGTTLEELNDAVAALSAEVPSA